MYREEARKLHESVNQKYGGYPYILHLDAVFAVYKEFKDEAPDFMLESVYYKKDKIYTQACYYHDSIEDCRVTPNDLINDHKLHMQAVHIVFGLTNEKGWKRDDRANDKYYKEMRNIVGATFVKMCDRIANVRFSRMMGSGMYEKYKTENENFMEKVEAHRFPRMEECLINLFK